MRTVQRTSLLRSVAGVAPPEQPSAPSGRSAARRVTLTVAGAGLLLAALGLSFVAGRREAVRVAAQEAAREAASRLAQLQDAPAGQLAARTLVSVRVTSSPPGALVRSSAGSATTPATLRVPRSSAPLTLQLSRPGYQDADIQVVPDVDRDHFVALQADDASAATSPAGDGGAADSGAPRILLERLVDTYLDARLRGCCQEAGPCGQVLLEGAVSASGRVSALAVHLNPPQPQAARCINAVLQGARRLRVEPGAAQQFERSYTFDAPHGSTVADGAHPSTGDSQDGGAVGENEQSGGRP